MSKSNKPVDGIDFSSSPSMTQQHFRDEVDINTIVRRMSNGQLPIGTRNAGNFMDVSGGMSYHDMLNHVKDVQEEFSSMHHLVRTRFRNDPQNLIDFLSDEKNLDEAISLGLIDKSDVLPPPEVNAPVNSVPFPSPSPLAPSSPMPS